MAKLFVQLLTAAAIAWGGYAALKAGLNAIEKENQSYEKVLKQLTNP